LKIPAVVDQIYLDAGERPRDHKPLFTGIQKNISDFLCELHALRYIPRNKFSY